MLPRRPKGFTLVEILIVVMILGILAAIVVPKYASASDESRRATLADQLRLFRDELSIYRFQHNYVAGVSKAVPGGTAAIFTSQMLGYSNADGDTSATRDTTHKFGPYLPELPSNPISGLSTLKYDWSYDAMPVPDNTTGWIYQPFTGRISANQTGADIRGKTFVSY